MRLRKRSLTRSRRVARFTRHDGETPHRRKCYMLTSVRIQKRQSEIRQSLAALVGKDKPDENEIRSMSDLDGEYQGNEAKFRAALIVERSEEHTSELQS